MLAVATEGCSGNTILQVSLLLFDILQQPKKQLHWSIFHQAWWAEHLLRPLCSFSSISYSFLREISFCWNCSVPGSFLLRGNTSASLLHSTAQQQPSLEPSISGTMALLMWGAKSWVCPTLTTKNFVSSLLQGILGWVYVTTSPIAINIFFHMLKMGSYVEIVEMRGGRRFLQRSLWAQARVHTHCT